MERIEIQGEWWLPDTPENRLFGTLVVEDNRIELALFGAFDQSASGLPPGLSMSGQSRAYPRIHGQSDSKNFTLDNCFQVRRTGYFGGLTTQRVTVHQVFEGIWFDLNEAIEFTQIVVKLVGFAEFVQRSGLSEKIENVEDDGKYRFTKASFSAVPVPKEDFSGLDGAECSLEHTFKSGSTEFRERHITEDFVLRIRYPGLQSSEALLKVASYLRDLVSIGTGRRAAFVSVSFRHPDVVHELSDDDKRPIPIEMYANWTVKPEPNKPSVKSHQVLFSLGDLGGVDALGRWLVVARRHATSLSRVMVSRYSDENYITDNLMNAVAALEGYDRDKHGDKINLVKRLKRSAATAGPQFTDLVGDVDEFTRLLTKARNTVAHHNSGVEGTTAQVFISRAAVWLLVLCLLRDADAPELVFDNIAKHTSWRWLKGQVAEVVAPSTSTQGS